MTLSRRRFLLMSACLAGSGAAPASAAGADLPVWRGRALGAEVSVTLSGADRDRAFRLGRRIADELLRIESIFSLHRESSLVRLNRVGRLRNPERDLLEMMRLAGSLHEATGGAFDPTVQPMWLALAAGADPAEARLLTGWRRVRVEQDAIELAPGMALTFNGIAQGHAADRIAGLLREEGCTRILVDTGEIRALGHRDDGRPWRAGIADVAGKVVRRVTLADRALATSSPLGTRIGPRRAAHIIHPAGQPAVWKTVSVSAASAAVADGLSTAFCLMAEPRIEAALARFPDARLELAI